MNEELDAVNSLRDWEKNTLRDADPNFKDEDDSDAEEAPKEESAAEK